MLSTITDFCFGVSQGCARVGKLLRELVVPSGCAAFGGVRTCLAIMQTSVGEDLGEAFDQVWIMSQFSQTAD